MFRFNLERKDVDDQTQCRIASFAFHAAGIGGPEVWTAGFRSEHGRVQNPHLLLQVRVQKKRSYFRGSDLKKMYRVQRTLTDPSTGLAHTYEGINLEALLQPGIFGSETAGVKISLGSHETLAIPRSDFDPGAKPMVADSMGGPIFPSKLFEWLLLQGLSATAVGDHCDLKVLGQADDVLGKIFAAQPFQKTGL